MARPQPARHDRRDPRPVHGYYTVHTLKDGKITGMLSVNGYSGEVWYHSWHGPFIASKEAKG